MILEDLQHIFRFQTTVTEEFTPKDTVTYVLIDPAGQSNLTKQHAIAELDKLLPLLDNFQLDAYRDRIPVFIKPEVIIAM
jgi:hypothetical protein